MAKKKKQQQKLELTPTRFKERLANLDEQRGRLVARAREEIGTYYTALVGGQAQLVESQQDIPYVEMWAEVHWTEKAAEMIRNDEFRYISPEFDLDYTDVGTGDRIGAALLAVGLVNRPFLKGMAKVEDPDEDNVSHVQVFATGEYFHPWYGRFSILPSHLQEMIDNIDAVFSSVREESDHPPTEMMVDFNHNSLFGSPDESLAAGWVRGKGIYTQETSESKAASEPPNHPSTTPSQGVITMKEERIREILQLGEDVETITDEHRDQALDALDAQLAEKPADESQQASEPASGTVQLSEEQHTQLQTQATAGEEALKKLQERDARDAAASALSEGKLTPSQKDWAEKFALKDPEGFAEFVASAPVVVDTTRHGSNQEDTRAESEKIQTFLDEKVAGGMDLADAQGAAQKQFGEEAFTAYRNRNKK
ncbi:MAG: hypothetical protein HOC74_10155 [Gemmatimonadetes bacterium]|jgi:phage I-like protein|nr:hypothetical protein [Gemmatimonadota bacterium]